jgi:hypothetical protein
MTTVALKSPPGSLLAPLLVLQGSLVIVSTVEAVVFGTLGFGSLGLPVFLGLGAALLILRDPAAMGQRRRRWLRRLEWFLIASAILDLALSVGMARRGLDPVGWVTRFGLPAAVLVATRESAV